MGVSPKRTLQNSNFLTTHAGHMKFSGGQIWKNVFPNGALQNSNFLTF